MVDVCFVCFVCFTVVRDVVVTWSCKVQNVHKLLLNTQMTEPKVVPKQTISYFAKYNCQQLYISIAMSYTLCLEKYTTWCWIITLANVDRFSKFFQQLIRQKILYVHVRDFRLTCNMLLHYIVKFVNPKMLLVLTASSTKCWHVSQNILMTWLNI